MAKRDDRQQEESRRIIDRIQAESDSGNLVTRTTRRLGGHLGARDADQHDWAEVWGTRIGRTIGAVVTVGVIIYLFKYLFSPT